MSSVNVVPSEPTTLKENDKDEGASANADVTPVQTHTNGAAPKDLRFWLIIFNLLIATFLSALDLTGKYGSFVWVRMGSKLHLKLYRV
jgi:hypothetical protein